MSAIDRAFMKAYACDEQPGTRLAHAGELQLAQCAQPSTPSHPAAAPQPLSEFAQASPKAGPASGGGAATGQVFDPALGVDAFAWPETCLRLFGASSRFEQIAEQLERCAAAQRRVIAICGAGRRVGGSTLLLCLARELARRNPRTIVVDANFRHPLLAEQLGLAITDDWHDALAGRRELAEVTVYSERDRLALLPLHRPADRQAPIARSIDVAYTFSVLRQHYPVVLVDAGSLAAGSPALDLLQQASIAAAILVNDARQGNEGLAGCAAQLATVGCSLLGVAENFCDLNLNDLGRESDSVSARPAHRLPSQPVVSTLHRNPTHREAHPSAAV